MKRFKYCVLGIFLLTALNGSRGQSATYCTLDSNAFSILCNDSLKHVVQTFETALGTQTYHTYFDSIHNTQGDFILMVSFVDYPEGSVHSDSIDLVSAVLDQTIESAVLSINGTLAYETQKEYGGYPGRLFKVFYNGGRGAVKTKLIFAKNRLYNIQVAATREISLDPVVDRFIESFRLLE